jgi:hypothetical protein
LITFVGKGKEEACKDDGRTLQTAVVAFYSDAGAWPINVDETINFAATYDSNDDGVVNASDASFEPDFVIKEPDSAAATKCNWSADATTGVVYADPAGADAAAEKAACDCYAAYTDPNPAP